MNIETASQSPLHSDVPAEARDFSVKDRIVLVTGSGQGIGRELVRQFAAAGSIVVVADLSSQNAQSVAAEISAAGGKALPLAVDVSKKESVELDGGGRIGGVRPR